MAKTNWQDPKTSEMRSTHIAGLMEAVGKVEDSIGMESVYETNIPLTEVFISSDDRYRIFQAPEGKRNWTAEQPPVIKRNGVTISSGFEVDYGGGAIVLNVNDTVANTYTADVTFIKQTEISSLKTQRFVIGTSTAGWTEKDCNYLCDGVDDQIEINDAIQALPANGGEIVILDGIYNITAIINVNKNNVKLTGNGNSTILKRMFGGGFNSVIYISDTIVNVIIDSIHFDGNRIVYSSGMYLSSIENNANDTKIINCLIENSKPTGISANLSTTIANCKFINNANGIFIDKGGTHNITCNYFMNNSIAINGGESYSIKRRCNISGNSLINNDIGIDISVDKSTIINNYFLRGTGIASDYTSVQYTIKLLQGNDNLISSNSCMGKNIVIETGLRNTVINNKWNATSDFEDLRTDVGDKTTLTTTDKTNLVNAVNETKESINDLDAEVVAHKAEIVTKVLTISEPSGQIIDTTVNLGFRPKNIQVDAFIDTKNYLSISYTSAERSICRYWDRTGECWISAGTGIYLRDSSSNYIAGAVTITDTGFSISWSKVGTLFDGLGTKRILISATTH